MDFPDHTAKDIPTYKSLMLPVMRAIRDLGGSATNRQITERALQEVDPDETLVDVSYENRAKSILVDRVEWARSYCKMGGLLSSPKRGLYIITKAGQELLFLPEEEAVAQVIELDSQVRKESRNRKARTLASELPAVFPALPQETSGEDDSDTFSFLDEDDSDEQWRDSVLSRLHEMTPTGFERFVLYLLRAYDLDLDHVGGPGDGGLDGFGTAPISEVMSATVAVQVKRYDPSNKIGRDTVALFQSDAANRGAERAIMVTLGDYTREARKMSRERKPTVDLITGEKLCDLMRDKEIGVRNVPTVTPNFFEVFDLLEGGEVRQVGATDRR